MKVRIRWPGTAALVLVLAACGPVFSPIDPAYQGQTLTGDHDDSYSLTVSGPTVTVRAPVTNVGSNLRALFFPTGQAQRVNEQTCATWSDQHGSLVQQGAVLRLSTVNGVTRAITVTKNIWFFGYWFFNVHVWDTGMADATPVASFDLSKVFGGSVFALAPLPWDLCARVVGSTLTFEAWVDGQPPPQWGDTTHGGSVTLPPGWDYAGNTGWYIGHLHPGDDASFANLVAGAPTRALPGAAATG